MEKDNLIKLFNLIKQDKNCNSDDLFVSFDFFTKNLEQILNVVNEELKSKVDNKEYDENYMIYAKNINEVFKELSEISSKFLPSNSDNNIKIEKDDSIDNSDVDVEFINNNYPKVDYSAYRVDNIKPHSLVEDFTNKRPYGYAFIDKDIVLASSWQKIYIDICEKLIYLDSEKFQSLKNILKGKKPYLTEYKTILRKPFKLSNGLFIETNQSAKDLIYNITRMLKTYSLPISDLKIYLNADYTKLHK